MNLKYSTLLQKHGLKEEQLSHKIKQAIKSINRIVDGTTAEEENLKNIKSERAVEAAKKRIEHAKILINEQDEELCERIETFVANKEVNQKRAANLEKARQNKAKPKPAETTDPAPVNDPVPPTEPTPPAEPTPAPTPAPAGDPSKKKEEKKGSGLGWIIGGVVAVALAAIGINAYNNRK